MTKEIKKVALFFVLTVSLGLAACGNAGQQNSSVTAQDIPDTTADSSTATDAAEDSNTQADSDADATDAAETESTDAWEVSEDVFFALTPEQKAIYDEYIKNADISVLQGASPVDVAKLYIQCGIEAEWEAEYNLYAQEGLTVTREEWQALNDKDIETLDLSTRQTQANYFFPYLQDGRPTEDGDTCTIIFPDADGGGMSMKLLRNGDGIWLVRMNPFD